MSQQLINHSIDLKRLRDEGYDIRIVDGHLVVDSVPYVGADQQIKLGSLVTDIVVSGSGVFGMGTHVATFIGDFPCDRNGRKLTKIEHGGQQKLGPNLTVDHSFSSKPVGGKAYNDYYHKIVTYIAIISGPAIQTDPSVDPRTFPVIEMSEEESVFRYHDTASSRAGIGMMTEKLKIPKVGIIGLGGTGSYVLDLVAKTPIGEIHLFDGDIYQNHNAFRSPGAATIDELRKRMKKADYFRNVYSRMRRHIYSHPEPISSTNVVELEGMGFVFICIDDGPAKKLIIGKLEEFRVPFIDVGMGIDVSDDGSLYGTLRVTTSTVVERSHVTAGNRIPFASAEGHNLYSTNIQVADLNCMNACLAVIKWKKLQGFYTDLEKEHFCAYSTDGNHLANDDQSCEETKKLDIAS